MTETIVSLVLFFSSKHLYFDTDVNHKLRLSELCYPLSRIWDVRNKDKTSNKLQVRFLLEISISIT